MIRTKKGEKGFNLLIFAIFASGFHGMSSAIENPSSLSFPDDQSAADSSSDMSALDDSDDQSWHSIVEFTVWESYGEGQFSGEIEGVPAAEMGHLISECSSEVDLESGDLGRVERDCRICHLELESGGGTDSDTPIQLGCCCRGDLGIAHKQCAETWFKIKGNTICEICGSTAQNVASQQINGPSNLILGIMNFLLACLLFAFGFFHFK